MAYSMYKLNGLTQAEVDELLQRESLSKRNRKIEVQPRLFDDKFDVEMIRDEVDELPTLTTDAQGQYFQLSMFRGCRE